MVGGESSEGGLSDSFGTKSWNSNFRLFSLTARSVAYTNRLIDAEHSS